MAAFIVLCLLVSSAAAAESLEKRALFGDLDTHTPVSQPDRPLDFYALTDHVDNTDVLAAWHQVAEVAETHNQPGELTTFVGFGYTVVRGAGGLHRNVIFQSARVADKPFSVRDSSEPADLWLWMDKLRARGIESMSITRNANRSVNFDETSDWRFGATTLDGSPVTPTYAAQRRRNEPLVSAVHPFSPVNDELTDLKSFPYRFGVVGLSDNHSSGASTLTGVWAEENSRAAIYAALRRKETFTTSGARIKLRMFAGFRLPRRFHNDKEKRTNLSRFGLPRSAVAMGGELGRGRGPLMISAEAMQDGQSAALQRLQVVKGWVEDGKTREQVFDIACSDNAAISSRSYRCSDSAAGVDLALCKVKSRVKSKVKSRVKSNVKGRPKREGAEVLTAIWRDPQFDPQQIAFYFVRVIENPACGQSAGDAGWAYTSPVWYSPDF